MTVVAAVPRIKGYIVQFLMMLAINVPVISFGLAMGWVSLASGEGAVEEEEVGGEGALVGAAAATFAAGAAGVPLAACALRYGRKPTLLATSVGFVVCWSLKLYGGWCVIAGRLAAGVAGVGAWVVVPLLATEMCEGHVRGAAVATLGLAHNLGILLMYVAADVGLHHRTVLLWCLGLSVVHFCLFLFAPESPAFLAAQGKDKEARSSLAWLRGVSVDHPSLSKELRNLPPHDDVLYSYWTRFKEMLSDHQRRRAFWILVIVLVGQESCGVLTLMQFAERVFMMARGEGGEGGGVEEAPGGAARRALLLGVVQLVASAAALYLVERVGRRPLVVWGAAACGGSLALGAGAARAGGAGGGAACAAALAAAVAADSLALQPAPYALLGDMFHYQYSECVVVAVMLAACAGNAAETLAFPALAARAGLPAALGAAAAATLALAAYAYKRLPETRARSPEQIYADMAPPAPARRGPPPCQVSSGVYKADDDLPVAVVCGAAADPGRREGGATDFQNRRDAPVPAEVGRRPNGPASAAPGVVGDDPDSPGASPGRCGGDVVSCRYAERVASRCDRDEVTAPSNESVLSIANESACSASNVSSEGLSSNVTDRDVDVTFKNKSCNSASVGDANPGSVTVQTLQTNERYDGETQCTNL